MLKNLTLLFIAVAALALPGCNAYMLQGKVQRGEVSTIELVHESDPRIASGGTASGGDGIAGAEIRFTRDPNRPNRRLVGQARSNPSGDFTVVMDEFGTGWMSEQWLVQAMVAGSSNAEQLMSLPGKAGKWRLLITLAPGTAEPFRNDDLMQDLERFR